MVEFNAEVAINDIALNATPSGDESVRSSLDIAYSMGGGLSNEVKQAILDCFAHVAWVDPEGADYYQALYDIFFPPAELVRISAVYTQSGTVYPTTSLDSLKSDLVVKAHYSDGSAVTLSSSDYTLSGTLSVGTSTVAVSYSGKNTSFTVTVTAAPTLSSITAVYTQSGTVYDTDTLDSLKTDLVVTAIYSDSSEETVPSTDYTLSGTLEEGTSTITVTYESKTTTFTVTVTAAGPVPEGYTMYDYVQTTKRLGNLAYSKYILLNTYTNLNEYSYVAEFGYDSQTGTESNAAFGGRPTTGSATSVALYVNPSTQKAAFHGHGTDTSWVQNFVRGQKNVAVYTNTTSSPSSVSVNGATASSLVWGTNGAINAAITVGGNVPTNGSYTSTIGVQCGRIKLYDLSENLVADYIPVVRDADNQIGMYDSVGKVFYTSTDTSYATIGSSNCFYKVGNWSA